MAHKLSKIESEFLLKAAMQTSLEIRVHGSGKVLKARIRELGPDRLSLELAAPPDRPFLAWDKAACYLDYHGQVLTFKATVRESDGRKLAIETPAVVYKDIARKNVRVPCPRGCTAELFLASDRFKLDYPECPEYADVLMPEKPVDGLDLGSMNSLIGSFREKAILEASENKIVMFKERKPDCYEEELLVRFGKAVYIPSTASGLTEKDPYPEGRLVTKAMEDDYEGTKVFIEGSSMERCLAEKVEKKIHAEIWVPIHYYQYVVGYVYLANSGEAARPLTVESLDFAWEFSRVLAYYLKTNNYFNVKENDAPPTYGGSVVDISASGMLVELPTRLLATRLRPQSALVVRLATPEKPFALNGYVARRFDGKESAFYGIAFGPLAEEDKRDLNLILYGCEPSHAAKDERDFAPEAGA